MTSQAVDFYWKVVWLYAFVRIWLQRVGRVDDYDYLFNRRIGPIYAAQLSAPVATFYTKMEREGTRWYWLARQTGA